MHLTRIIKNRSLAIQVDGCSVLKIHGEGNKPLKTNKQNQGPYLPPDWAELRTAWTVPSIFIKQYFTGYPTTRAGKHAKYSAAAAWKPQEHVSPGVTTSFPTWKTPAGI